MESRRAPLSAGQASNGPRGWSETRPDPENGRLYSKVEFAAHYGPTWHSHWVEAGELSPAQRTAAASAAAPPSITAAPILAVGSEVVAHSLVRRADLNGRLARVLAHRADGGVVVDFGGADGQLPLRLRNLLPLDSLRPPPPQQLQQPAVQPQQLAVQPVAPPPGIDSPLHLSAPWHQEQQQYLASARDYPSACPATLVPTAPQSAACPAAPAAQPAGQRQQQQQQQQQGQDGPAAGACAAPVQEASIAQVRSELAAQERQLTQQQQQLHEAQALLAHTSQHIERLQHEMGRLRDTGASSPSCSARMESTERRLRAADAQLGHVAAADAHLDVRVAQLEAARRRGQEMEAEIAAIRELNDRQAAQLAGAQRAVAELRSRVQGLESDAVVGPLLHVQLAQQAAAALEQREDETERRLAALRYDAEAEAHRAEQLQQQYQPQAAAVPVLSRPGISPLRQAAVRLWHAPPVG